jgi:hypothetical protein
MPSNEAADYTTQHKGSNGTFSGFIISGKDSDSNVSASSRHSPGRGAGLEPQNQRANEERRIGSDCFSQRMSDQRIEVRDFAVIASERSEVDAELSRQILERSLI